MTSRNRLIAFAIVMVGCVALAIGYGWFAVRTEKTAPIASASDPHELAGILREPHLLFRNTRQGPGYGRLSVVSLANPAGERYVTGLECERVDMVAGVGVCLTADRGVFTTYSAVVFDRSFAPIHSTPLSGIPSRVRVSPDGRLAGITVFVNGHSYAQNGFSTATILLDTETGEALANLEEFEVTRDARRFTQQDFNFWGVTFARDSNTFYATLASGSALYLVRGDAKARTATVIATGMECPSLSPDNQLIAFKKREMRNGGLMWQLAVLTLATGQERVLNAESRSVDDQVAWLDQTHLLYSTPNPNQPGSMTVSVLSIETDDSAADLIPDAYSPSPGLL